MANITAQVAHRAGARVEGPTHHKHLHDDINDEGLHVACYRRVENALLKCLANLKLIAQCDIGDALIDPYIRVALMPWRIQGQTATKMDQEDDVVVKWDETINLLVPDDPPQRQEGGFVQRGIIIQAWDEDVGEDDLLGQTEIGWDRVQAAMEAPNVPQDLTVLIKDADNEECGVAQLALTFEPTQPDQRVVGQHKGKWKGAQLGNLAVHVNTVAGLSNPFAEISTTADDQQLIMKCAMLVIFYFALGAIVFINTCKKEVEDADGNTVWVDWTFVDSLYFAVVTITTTGYGDLLPKNADQNLEDGAKVFACFFAYFGVGVIAAVMGFLLAILVEKHSGQNLLDQVKSAASDALHKAEGALSQTKQRTGGIPSQHHIKLPFIGHFDRRKIPWKYIRAGVSLLIFKFAGALYYSAYDGDIAHCALFLRQGHSELATYAGGTWTNVTAAEYDGHEKWSEWTETQKATYPALAAGGGNVCDCNHMWDAPRTKHGNYSKRLEDFQSLGYCTIEDMSGVDNVRHHMKSFLDAIYMACITMTSVGYGEFSPQNQNARVFAIFWILGGTLFVGNFFGMLVDDYMASQQRKLAKRLLNREFGKDDMRKLDKDGDGEITELEFFTYMVVKLGKTTKEEVEGLREQFRAIDKTGDGFITKEDLELMQKEHVAKMRESSIKIKKASLNRPIQPVEL